MSTVLTAAILGTLVFLASVAITGTWLLTPPDGGHCAPDPSGLAGARARACARPHPEPPVPAGLWPAWDDGTWQPARATPGDLTVAIHRPEFATCPQEVIHGGRPYAAQDTAVLDGTVLPVEVHDGTADIIAVAINGHLDYREEDQ